MPWEVRKTGSAAIESAFVAAGLLRVARFNRPNVWDVAGGIALVWAAGGAVRTLAGGEWQEFERFEPTAGSSHETPDLGCWRQPLALGEPEAVALLCRAGR